MAQITHVVAIARNLVIGQKGTLPWHIPGELKEFKRLTLNKPVIMGRKTWESLPIQPLPQRKNIVISRQNNLRFDGAVCFLNLNEAIDYAYIIAKQDGADEIAIIGGGELFNQSLALAQKLYITEIAEDYEGDVYYPDYQKLGWKAVYKRLGPETTTGAKTYFCCYEKDLSCDM